MDAMHGVTELTGRYREAVAAKDVDAMLALYDRDVRVFDTWGAWSYEGHEAWRQVVSEWFGSLGRDQVAAQFDEVHVVAGDQVAALQAFVTYRGLSPEGAEQRSMTNRLTWALRRTSEGGWKVFHEHTSAPISVKTSTAILRRD